MIKSICSGYLIIGIVLGRNVSVLGGSHFNRYFCDVRKFLEELKKMILVHLFCTALYICADFSNTVLRFLYLGVQHIHKYISDPDKPLHPNNPYTGRSDNVQ